MKKMIALIAGMLLALPAMALASGGLIGDCVDCHTMHNSEQGQAVAIQGTAGTTTTTPLANLLRMDCIACHANDPSGAVNILDNGGGSQIPQVMHSAATDLAGGNFRYVEENSRHGHNVVDLVDPEPYQGQQQYAVPPGKYAATTHGSREIFGTLNSGTFDKLTCAGNAGCHGTRNAIAGYSYNGVLDADNNGQVDNVTGITRLTGIAAISGAHHANYDGLKDPTQIVAGSPDGAEVAAGYRFIPGLKGYGNETNRWQNTATDHNEYFGIQQDTGSGCGTCHLESGLEVSSHLAEGSKIRVPNQSMSGFCTTCHGAFHSVGDTNGDGLSDNGLDANSADSTSGLGMGENGISGAFQRHPSDYVLPTTGEYANYTVWTNTAPVARPLAKLQAADGTDLTVEPGADMVMCLSCHMAHGSPNDYMLRFDYSLQTAGNAAAADLGTGCLACHTTKGVLK